MTYLVFIFIVVICYKKYSKGLYTYGVGPLFVLKYRKKFCIIIGMLLTMLLVLRNDYFGTDTQNYHHLFDTIEIYYDPSFSDVVFITIEQPKLIRNIRV